MNRAGSMLFFFEIGSQFGIEEFKLFHLVGSQDKEVEVHYEADFGGIGLRIVAFGNCRPRFKKSFFHR